ncbi:MAG: hypothetical protein FWC56_02495 [Phycisphaerae bacterium]|nr:hypothetical protein [Phycisphaerae bacterium]
MTVKSLDIKLAKIKADPSCREFILADAKDADMAFGIGSPGKSPEHYAQEGKFRSLPEFHEIIRQIVRQGLVDIMLMSAHANDILTIKERLFDHSHVTPAARANDTTDIHVIREGAYISQPSRPFQSTTIDHIQCGRVECPSHERGRGANLGLYSVTFNNDLDLDQRSLEEYKKFRIEAEKKGFKHFLEVFDPNAPQKPIASDKLGGYINDMITRCLAGVPEAGRPLFLKMVYHGPKWTEELAHYDPKLVIGILGGSSGTTYDGFKLISEAQKYGAKVALFGRKINNAENQLAFIEMLRRIVDGQISAEEAVRAYHGILQALGIKPYRSLEDDMQLTTGVMSYGSSSQTRVPAVPTASQTVASSVPVASSAKPTASPAKLAVSLAKPAVPRAVSTPKPAAVMTPSADSNGKSTNHGKNDHGKPAGQPDFGKMTSEERVAYHRSRLANL